MKLIQSPLQFKKFNLLEYGFKLILNDKYKKVNIKEELFPHYLIEVDFAWKKNNEEHLVYCKLEVNREKQAGYHITTEGVGFFKLHEGVSEIEAKQLMMYSAPSIVLQELRALIRNNTFIGPYGAYVLPTVNTQPQIKQKFEELSAKKTVKKRVTK